ncbi:MAG: DJ-1/PfpI family protein [Candidatus Saganbacteria bacterium]|nr:DJ-1/PfpI family protein [Candidatus Saganbacteria bacterium]
MKKKAVMIIAFNEFRDEEYLEPKKVLEKAGIEVTTASTRVGIARGKLGGQVKVDILLKQIQISDYDAVIFIGGPGSYAYFDDPQALKIAEDCDRLGKVLAGICSAVAILANAETLKGKDAACFVGVARILKDKGAKYNPGGVAVDGKTITADGPAHAKEFGEAIVAAL